MQRSPLPRNVGLPDAYHQATQVSDEAQEANLERLEVGRWGTEVVAGIGG